MSLQKNKPIRSKKYRDWVKTLPCILTGVEPAGGCHHGIAIGEGGVGTKACDLLSMPVTEESHQKFHRLDLYPELKEEQWRYIAKTLQRAIKEGALSKLSI